MTKTARPVDRPVDVGSFWADNKIWALGRVVKIIRVTATHAIVEVTNDPSQARGHIPGVPRKHSLVGRRYRIKLDRFRSLDRPRHGYFLPAEGPHDGLDRIVTTTNPSTAKGMPHPRLLKLKYDNGWTVRTATGVEVDFDPRRKGDGRAWRAANGDRFPSTQCHAIIGAGARVDLGQTIEDGGALILTHLVVAWPITSCGLGYVERPWTEVSPLDGCTLCTRCAEENPKTAMAVRLNSRLGRRVMPDHTDARPFIEQHQAALAALGLDPDA